ncbi:MAG: nucleotidyltransferase family protein [Anaerolineae bacterium]|nr:nucleotidyltransferase family protein [Anaerolineae bacterium]
MTINPVQSAIPIPYEELARFCEKHHLVRLWLFGSVLRDDFTPESDLDVLVEFDPQHVPGWEFSRWYGELENIFGRPVDLTTPSALSQYIKKKVMCSAEVVYERTG